MRRVLNEQIPSSNVRGSNSFESISSAVRCGRSIPVMLGRLSPCPQDKSTARRMRVLLADAVVDVEMMWCSNPLRASSASTASFHVLPGVLLLSARVYMHILLIVSSFDMSSCHVPLKRGRIQIFRPLASLLLNIHATIHVQYHHHHIHDNTKSSYEFLVT